MVRGKQGFDSPSRLQHMTNAKLIQLAASVIKPRKLGDRLAGDVGSALISDKGKVYTGICIDTAGIGFCAEQNAIAQMVTNGEYKIKKIVAVWKDQKKMVHVIHPCGHCREFMRQLDKGNMKTKVILGKDRVVILEDLLPYQNDFSPVI